KPEVLASHAQAYAQWLQSPLATGGH
ncbi:TPA: glutathione-regulated potassium-efflux system ancillary protein KefG, partial [Yersinia enterocolitica]|nr:glutathione-regulated potassium-efflux system ancillary protein KefG [Yersinia enterocolitica]